MFCYKQCANLPINANGDTCVPICVDWEVCIVRQHSLHIRWICTNAHCVFICYQYWTLVYQSVCSDKLA